MFVTFSAPGTLDYIRGLATAMPPSAAQLDFLNHAITYVTVCAGHGVPSTGTTVVVKHCHRCSCLFRWSKTDGDKSGDRDLYLMAAMSAWKQSKYAPAFQYFLTADAPQV